MKCFLLIELDMFVLKKILDDLGDSLPRQDASCQSTTKFFSKTEFFLDNESYLFILLTVTVPKNSFGDVQLLRKVSATFATKVFTQRDECRAHLQP